MRKILLMTLTITIASPLLAVAATSIDVGFSPAISHSASAVVLNGIKSARNSINVAAYSFTSKPIATALIAAKRRGVTVRVVADQKANNDRYTAVTFLSNQGVPVRLNSQYAIMHNKFMVIDGDTVQTGSLNYTASAVSRNAENVLLIRDSPELAKAYQDEFNRLWNESTALNSRY